MSFLQPLFALGAALFVVPIVIHLIGRSRAKMQRFAAIELLLRSERKVARRTRLRQLLLLTLRALAIAAVPLILAKPFFEAESDLPAAVGGAQSAVIVLDDSLSMSLSVGGSTLLERGKARARRILDAMGRDAEVALLVASRGGSGGLPELTADRARLDRAIAEVKPSFRATDATGALRRAAQLLQSAPRPEKRVYLISDLAAHGFDKDPPWPAGGPELVPIDVADGKPLANRAITDLRVEPAGSLGPRGVRVTVEVANFSDEPAKQLPVALRIDGKVVAKGLVDIEPQQKVQKRFFHALQRGGDEPDVGVHEVAAELAHDALPSDDARFARVEVRRDVRVLLVDGDPRTVRRDDELFYLEAALHPGEHDESQLDLSTTTADELKGKSLSDWDVVFLCNVKAPAESGAVAQLREFVQHGGGLFLSLGDNVDPDAYDQAFGDLLPQPLQVIRTAPRADEGEHLQRARSGHPVLAPLIGLGKDDALAAARFTRYGLFKPTAADGDRDVLLHFESGAPAMIEKKLGEGRVLLFASTIDRDWNDLAIQPIFLPLLQQATRYLARAPMHDPEAPALVGQRHDLTLSTGDTRVEVTLPSGQTRTFERDRVAGRRTLGFGETQEPGVYRVAVAEKGQEALKPRPSATFVVNVDPVESNLGRLSPERLAQLASGGTATKGVRAPRRKVELWHAMGAGLLLLLLGEALLLRRK
jgi:hypothetical protein